jgi:hypothetical protein
MDIGVPDMTGEETKANKQCTGLGSESEWYRDESRKSMHRDLVRAGMERTRQQGKRIGRPRVSERPEFNHRFAAVAERIALGKLSKRQAAEELNIGYATLKRLLDSQMLPSQSGNESLPPIPVSCDTSRNVYAEML